MVLVLQDDRACLKRYASEIFFYGIIRIHTEKIPYSSIPKKVFILQKNC